MVNPFLSDRFLQDEKIGTQHRLFRALQLKILFTPLETCDISIVFYPIRKSFCFLMRIIARPVGGEKNIYIMLHIF